MAMQKRHRPAELGSFDAEQPTAFYLLDDREGLEALSDATLVVQDVELPVHSQVLCVQSKVLLDMFGVVTGSQAAAASGKEKVVLKEPFSGCDLFEVALFLRCAYCPTSLTPDNLVAVRGSLLGLLRLADKLDASRIMQAVAQSLGECVNAATLQAELLTWAEAAEQYCLPELKMCCLIEMARRLAHGGDSLAASFSATAELARCCDHSTLSMLLGLVAAGCGPIGAPRVASVSPAAAVKALESSADHGSFEWVVERYSQLPAAMGEPTYSPYFCAAGVDWRFKVYPGGQESADRVAVECCQPRRRASAVYLVASTQGNFTATCTVTVVDQGPAKANEQKQTTAKVFTDSTSWGWAKFMLAAQLHDQFFGYLKGDRLVLRASVEVTARNASQP